MPHNWSKHISIVNPDNGVVHLIRNTGHALIFLTEHWRWRKAAAYRDALSQCAIAFEADRSQDDARDAFRAALISARLVHRDFGACDCAIQVTSFG